MPVAPPRTCACDCACGVTGEPEPFLLDTNFLSALARIAARVAADLAPDSYDAPKHDAVFRELLAILGCCGQRRLLLAREQLDDEINGGRRWPFT